MKGKIVLVTGANGFIGRLLAKALLAEDVQVRCLVRLYYTGRTLCFNAAD